MDNTKASDLRQAPEYGRYIEKIGWQVENVYGVSIFIRKFGPVAFAKIQRADVEDWKILREILRKNRVFSVKYEPLNTSPLSFPSPESGEGLGRGFFGFYQDSWPMLATKTLRVDLRPSEKKILASFKKDTRYCLRKAQSDKGAKVQRNDFWRFYEIWKRANGIKRLWTPSYKNYLALVECFGEKCFCVTINNLAGALILTHKRTAYYYYAGSLPEGKKLHLPYSVVWECMKEAKKRGCKTWDFEGTYDPRWPNKDILGYTHFKKSFGGEEVEFAGSFTRWF